MEKLFPDYKMLPNNFFNFNMLSINFKMISKVTFLICEQMKLIYLTFALKSHFCSCLVVIPNWTDIFD